MLPLLCFLLLAPLGVLGVPVSFSLGQLVLQFPNSLEAENAAPSPPSAVQPDGPSSSVVPLDSPSPSAVSLVYQFKHERLENLHARLNGHLIVSVVNEPLMYDLDPTKPGQPPTLIHNFTGAGVASLLGIAEYAPDVFAVVTGNWTSPLTHTPGSFRIYSVDLSTPNKPPKVTMIAAMPEANALNGMASLYGGPADTVLVVDSFQEAIWKLNVSSGEYSMAIESPLFGNTSSNPMGINGLRSVPGYIYFFNSAQGSYGRVPIDDNVTVTGEVQILSRVDQPGQLWDDFDLDWEGNAWVATHAEGVYEVTVEGKQRNITGIVEPTSARFGRGSKQQEKTLYLSTVGNGTGGGQIVALNTCLV